MPSTSRERHPAGPALERDRAAAIRRAERPPEAQLLQLQRAAGNRAAARAVDHPQMIQRAAGNRAVAGAVARAQPVQRKPANRVPARRPARPSILQRAAGRSRAVAGAAVVPGQPVQRQALDPVDVIKAVESSSFLKKKLASSTSAQKRAPTGERMRERVQKTLESYEKMFGGADAGADNAMMLALAVDGAAKVIADELYDPGLKGKISKILFDVYGAKIQGALAKKKGVGEDGAGKAWQFARALGSGDPVTLYMHEEMRLEHAAHEVARMAQMAKVEPKAMFESLSRRYQSELATYTWKEVSERQHKGARGAGAYKITEATGEMSTDFFEHLFGKQTGLKSTERPPGADKPGGLTFTKEAAAKLDELKDAVENDKGKPLPATAGERRKQHLEGVKAADDTIDVERTGDVKTFLTSKWNVDGGKADAVIKKLRDGLPGLPLTITVWGKRFFGDRTSEPAKGKVDPEYKAGTSQLPEQELAKIIGVKGTKTKKLYGTEKLEHQGEYKDAYYGAERGENYLRFRHWKDQMMTGNLGFKPEELPVFGAVNPHWQTTRGTGGFVDDPVATELAQKEQAGQALTAEEKQRLDKWRPEAARRRQVESEHKDVGINYYGDTHFLLNKAKIQDRVVYTATDHGQPHRDPFLAFADFLLQSERGKVYGGKAYRHDITRLKPQGLEETPAAAYDVVNAILDPTNAPLVKRNLPFEIQIFGVVDVRNDVDEIHVSPGAPDGVFDKADAWAKANAPRLVGKVFQIDVPIATRLPLDTKDAQLKGAGSPAEKAKAAAKA